MLLIGSLHAMERVTNVQADAQTSQDIVGTSKEILKILWAPSGYQRVFSHPCLV